MSKINLTESEFVNLVQNTVRRVMTESIQSKPKPILKIKLSELKQVVRKILRENEDSTDKDIADYEDNKSNKYTKNFDDEESGVNEWRSRDSNADAWADLETNGAASQQRQKMKDLYAKKREVGVQDNSHVPEYYSTYENGYIANINGYTQNQIDAMNARSRSGMERSVRNNFDPDIDECKMNEGFEELIPIAAGTAGVFLASAGIGSVLNALRNGSLGDNGKKLAEFLNNLKNKSDNQQPTQQDEMCEGAKPSAGMSKSSKSNLAKKARAGEDIGKPGKNFDKVANKAAKEYGSKEAGEKVAAAAMYKNAKR